MQIALLVAQGLLAVAFLGAGASKLAGADSMTEDFDRFGYSRRFMHFTGGMEIFGTLALVAGFWWPLWAVLGAGAIATTMLGALGTHLRTGDPVGRLLPPLVLGALAAWVLVAHGPALGA